MQTKLSVLLILSVLFMSAERVIDLASAAHVHTDEHASGFDPSATPSSPLEPHSEQTTIDCDHCLHAHLAGILVTQIAPGVRVHDAVAQFAPAALINHPPAPPTPPPNA